MRAVFGIASLLVVLAVVGIVAGRQLNATLPAAAVPPQAQQVQEQVRQDVQEALDKAARRVDAEQ